MRKTIYLDRLKELLRNAILGFDNNLDIHTALLESNLIDANYFINKECLMEADYIILREDVDHPKFNLQIPFSGVKQIDKALNSDNTVIVKLDIKPLRNLADLIPFFEVENKLLGYHVGLHRFCLVESMNKKGVHSDYSVNKFSWTTAEMMCPFLVERLGFDGEDIRTFIAMSFNAKNLIKHSFSITF